MTVVLDASAVLAFLKMEPGAEVVRDHLQGALLSAVNLLEVMEKSIKVDQGTEKIVRLLLGWQVDFVPFDTDQALIAATIRERVGKADLSLADRVCLALAKSRNLPVVTGDRLWATLPIGVNVILIREPRH